MTKYALPFTWGMIALMLAIIFLPDALKPTPPGPTVFAELQVKTDDYAHIYVDHETGCQYVRMRLSITPRLGQDGKPMCGLSK